MDTISERLFAAICERHGYEVSELRPSDLKGVMTADFSVVTPECRLIVEVEELTPNSDDLRQIREMKLQGHTHGGGKVGARARRAIRHASLQLRSHRKEKVPMLIVLYNNIRTKDGCPSFPMTHLESYHVDAAMYGFLVVSVSLGVRRSQISDRSGGGRTLTHDEKTYVSAVAVISDWDDNTMFVYHNSFAALPLPTTVFSDEHCVHFQKPSGIYESPMQWERCSPAQLCAGGGDAATPRAPA